jgi:hypothetical protein
MKKSLAKSIVSSTLRSVYFISNIFHLSLGENKPIWMQAEEREENKVTCASLFLFLQHFIDFVLTFIIPTHPFFTPSRPFKAKNVDAKQGALRGNTIFPSVLLAPFNFAQSGDVSGGGPAPDLEVPEVADQPAMQSLCLMLLLYINIALQL